MTTSQNFEAWYANFSEEVSEKEFLLLGKIDVDKRPDPRKWYQEQVLHNTGGEDPHPQCYIEFLEYVVRTYYKD